MEGKDTREIGMKERRRMGEREKESWGWGPWLPYVKPHGRTYLDLLLLTSSRLLTFTAEHVRSGTATGPNLAYRCDNYFHGTDQVN